LGYKIENGKLKITITPGKGNFSPDDVSYSYGDYQYDLIITLGVSELKKLGSLYEDDPEIFYKTETVNIDNNPKNQQYGEINWLDKKASSICEMMVSLLEALEVEISGDIATLLLTGLISSTNRFQSDETDPKVLTVAAQLMAAGGNKKQIIKELYGQTPYTYLKGWGRMMENLNLDPALNFAFTYLSRKELIELKIENSVISQALDRLLSNIKEAKVVALIQETKQGIKVSLRSNNDQVDVSKLAARFDGGGQSRKAGFDLRGDYQDLKKKAVRLIKDYLKENL
jgi:phosphoesterase RecJ-like protein